MKISIKDLCCLAAVDKVTLDGVEQKWAVQANTETGKIRRYVIKDGKPVLKNFNITYETVKGKVEVFFNPGWTMTDNCYYFNGKIQAKHKPRHEA